jgi:hypothetical protein
MNPTDLERGIDAAIALVGILSANVDAPSGDIIAWARVAEPREYAAAPAERGHRGMGGMDV